MSKLDELDRAERAMTPGPWGYGQDWIGTHGETEDLDAPIQVYFQNNSWGGNFLQHCIEAQGLAEIRNHARALIDVARAAAREHKPGLGHELGHMEHCRICAALARLEAE